MRRVRPVSQPYDHGMLDVGDGQLLSWEQSGSTDGKPALVLHGGPGSGTRPAMRDGFDLARYRVVLVDQRGAGRSRPHASEPTTDLAPNTTHHLVADLERVREHLGIDRWLVWGLSWGVTLGLAYAQRHPDRVSEMVLGAVTLTRAEDLEWLYGGLRRFLPEQWGRFRAAADAGAAAAASGAATTSRAAGGDGKATGEDRTDLDTGLGLIATYRRLLADPDPAVRTTAARAWCAWEDAVAPSDRYGDPRFRMGFARVVTHYFHHRAWLDDGELLARTDRLAGIPAVLAHGRWDLASPPIVPWELARRWPDAELRLVDDGHGGASVGQVMVEATDRFAGRR